MAEVLNSMVGDSDRICALSGEKLIEALATLLERAERKGDIVLEVEPLDLLCAIAGRRLMRPSANPLFHT